MVLLDTIIIFAVNMLLSLLVAKQDKDFFAETFDGVHINKVVNVGEEEFQSSISISSKSGFFGPLDDVIELDEAAYQTTKRGAMETNYKASIQKISECSEDDNTVTNSQGS
jgi:hypothetical protein